MKRLMVLLISFGALGGMWSRPNIQSLTITVLVCLTVASVIYYKTGAIGSKCKYLHREFVLIDILIIVGLMRWFYISWDSSSLLIFIGKTVHLPEKTIRYSIMIILGLVALHAVDSLLCTYHLIMHKHIWLSNVTWVFPFSAVQYMILAYSATWSLLDCFIKDGGIALLINSVLLMIVNVLMVLIFRNLKGALTFSTVMVCAYSIANYYVIKFHGSPLFPSEFANIKTAKDVIAAYEIEISKIIIVILMLSAVCIFAIIHFVPNDRIKTRKRLGYAPFFVIVIVVGMAGIRFLAPTTTEWAPWRFRILVNGYVVESIVDFYKMKHPFDKPEGYSEVLFEEMLEKEDNNIVDSMPDVIFILNESFCDLAYSVDIDTDADCMRLFRNIEGAVYGYAVAPNVGGGTNDSEFELLTSKSRSLLRNNAPFTYLEDELLQRSIVCYLKDCFGYETSGLHCGDPENYSRSKAYPCLEFDHVYLGGNYFTEKKYGNRKWLDSDNYLDLIKYYEECGDNPRMMFMLTFQNHGGYRQNDGSYDTVHVKNDFGKLTEDMSEYLSSIELSSRAFSELTEYFRDAPRDVIICMVGDHAPSFISELPCNAVEPIIDSDIAKQMVPYVIWSNFEMNTSFYTDYATMTDLIPMTLKAAKIPLSKFYKTVLELHESVPIRTKEGTYIDREFNSGQYREDNPYTELFKRYYYMEYNSLLSDEEYREDLFMVN